MIEIIDILFFKSLFFFEITRYNNFPLTEHHVHPVNTEEVAPVAAVETIIPSAAV
jgi:hypothetical protein